MSEPGQGRFEELDPHGDIVLVGALRKDKSKTERFAVLWAVSTSGSGVARLEIYADEKSFNKKKSPKNKILINDIESCDPTDMINTPSSKDLHRFVIKFKTGDTFYYSCTSLEHQTSWCGWIQEFVSGFPDVGRHGFYKSFPNVKMVSTDLAGKIGLITGAPKACTLAFNSQEVGIFVPQYHRPRFTVQVRLLRSAGYSGNLMHFQCGRRTVCGPGYMYFETQTEYEAKVVKDALFEEMSRDMPGGSPPLPNGVPSNSASMAYTIVNNGRPQQPIPGVNGNGHGHGSPSTVASSPPVNGHSSSDFGSSLPRSSYDSPPHPMRSGGVPTREGSVRAHRPRAAPVSAASQPRHCLRQQSEPCCASGSSLGRQYSLRAASTSCGSETDGSSYMASPSNRKLSMYEDMHSPWQSRLSGAESHRLSNGGGDHQDTYEDMHPVHSRTNSTVSDMSASSYPQRDSSLDMDSPPRPPHPQEQLRHSQSASDARRAIPDGLADSSVPNKPGLYTNKSVQEVVSSPSDMNYMNFEPMRNQRSSRNKHLEVKQSGRADRDYENLWVVVNHPEQEAGRRQSEGVSTAPIAIRPKTSTPRNSVHDRSELEASNSWNNQPHTVSSYGQNGCRQSAPRSSFSGENGGVFSYDEQTSPPRMPGHVSQQS